MRKTVCTKTSSPRLTNCAKSLRLFPGYFFAHYGTTRNQKTPNKFVQKRVHYVFSQTPQEGQQIIQYEFTTSQTANDIPQATFELGSSAKQASKTASETWSQSLSKTRKQSAPPAETYQDDLRSHIQRWSKTSRGEHRVPTFDEFGTIFYET